MSESEGRLSLRLAVWCLAHDQAHMWAQTPSRSELTIGFRDAITEVLGNAGGGRPEPILDDGVAEDLRRLQAILGDVASRIGPLGTYTDAAGTAEWAEVPPAAEALHLRLAPSPLVDSLGVLSLPEISPDSRTRRQELVETANMLPTGDRGSLATYLRGGTFIFAAMEWTWDVIGDAFNRAGGSGLLSDGDYYWRGDAADYVEHYGIGLPTAFIEHARNQGWHAPKLCWEQKIEISDYLYARRSTSFEAGQ